MKSNKRVKEYNVAKAQNSFLSEIKLKLKGNSKNLCEEKD